MKKNIVKNLIITVLLCVSNIYYLCLYNEFCSYYFSEFLSLVTCNFFMCVCLFFICNKKQFYIFEPIVFVWFLYYMIFVYCPLVNLSKNNITECDINIIEGCVKGTYVFIFSYISMLCGYYMLSNDNNINSEIKNGFDENEIFEEYYKWNKMYVFLWLLVFLSFLSYNTLVGRNPIYMLTFGTTNLGLGTVSSLSLGILSTFVYLSFYPMMMIILYDKSLLFKISIYYMTCVPIATRGFRNVLTVCLIAPVVYYFAKNKKQPSIKIGIIVMIVFTFMFGFLGNTRGGLRSGKGLSAKQYKYTSGMDNILYYFESYKVYYGAVMNYPKIHNYTYGKQLLYTITMYIPRYFWAGKPKTPLFEAISNSTSEVSAIAGSAWPNIGEYYTDLGITGTIIIMFLLGLILYKMKQMYNSPSRKLKYVILYSLYLPALVTIIAYGYTAGNTPQYVIMAFPLFLQMYLEKRKIHKVNE